MGQDVTGAISLGQNFVGQDVVGQDVTGAKLLGQNVVGQEVSGAERRGAERRGAGRHWGNIPGAGRRGAGRRGAELRGAGRRWGKISGAGGHGAEGSGAGSGSPSASDHLIRKIFQECVGTVAGSMNIPSNEIVITGCIRNKTMYVPSRDPVTISGAPNPIPKPPTPSIQFIISECAFTEYTGI